MAYTDINSEDRLVQETFAGHLKNNLAWESVYAWNEETFGPGGMLGRADTREVILTRDLRAALERLNPQLPTEAIASVQLTVLISLGPLQHNQNSKISVMACQAT
jgi:type I restriction enzyme R subunit